MGMVANAAGRRLEHLTMNIGGRKPRREKLEGRDYLVAPARILKEEVLNGSGGPGFYPHEENAKKVGSWNHMPLVVDHPTLNGLPVSARTPDVLNSRKVGLLLNAVVNDADKAVDAECWFDVEKTRAVDKRLLTRIENGEQTECSTGLFINQDPVKGKFGETAYDFIAREHDPDHLALLVDKIGALSVKMGGGLFANAEQEPEGHRVVQQRTAENALKAVGIEFVGNELSFNTITRQLADVLSTTYGEKGKYWEGWPTEVFSDHVIFHDGKGKCLKQNYTATDKGVALSGKAVEVVRTVSYQPVTGNSAPGLDPKEQTMDKTATVNSLISTGGYAEADREWLMGLTDDHLKKIKPVVANATPAPVVSPLSAEDVAVLNYGRQQLNARKVAMVNSLKALGPRCPYNEGALNAMAPDHLEALCVLAQVGPAAAAAGGTLPVGNANSPFAPTFVPGMWGQPAPQPTGNYLMNAGGYLAPAPGGGDAGRAEKDEDGLDEPVLNFEKKSA